ncbi:MAG: hypothetical protein ACE5EH_08140, partial [Gammaproteobacteria bacterium]
MRFSDLRNELDWWLQGVVRWSPPVIKPPVGNREKVSAGFSVEQLKRFSELNSNYKLSGWEKVCNHREYLTNLYFLDILDKYVLEKPLGKSLDIGSSSWGYLPSLVTWSGQAWDGVELDAYRRYWTLATRQAYASFMVKHYPGCEYYPCSLSAIKEKFSFITWFLPFVLPGSHILG